MLILGIESSCDETAAAVVKDGVEILSNVVVSQIDIFKEYGGVIPEVAARSHLEAILPVVKKALDDAGVTKEEIDAIAVTYAPGLLGSLLIGTLTARMLAILWQKPLYAVHHLKSHIYANWLGSETEGNALSTRYGCRSQDRTPPAEGRGLDPRQPNVIPRSKTLPSISLLTDLHENSSSNDVPQFPLIALVVSGGHTQIIYMEQHNQFEIIGTTRDDAVGECFDKVAKILGLPYPGGPSVAKCAENGDPLKYKLPHPQVEGLDFSFSGLKTAVLRAVQAELGLPISIPSYELASKLSEQQRADFAASFQKTAVDILLDKLEMALRAHSEAKTVVLAGGVSANKVLRNETVRRLKMSLSDKLVCRQQGCRSQNTPQVGALQCHSRPSAPGRAAESSRSSSDITKLLLDQDSSTVSSTNTISSDGLIPQKPCEMEVFFPDVKLSGDNAAMVGAAAYFEIISGVEPTDPYSLDIMPRVEIH